MHTPVTQLDGRMVGWTDGWMATCRVEKGFSRKCNTHNIYWMSNKNPCGINFKTKPVLDAAAAAATQHLFHNGASKGKSSAIQTPTYQQPTASVAMAITPTIFKWAKDGFDWMYSCSVLFILFFSYQWMDWWIHVQGGPGMICFLYVDQKKKEPSEKHQNKRSSSIFNIYYLFQ